MYSTANLIAADMWHERIGRFISNAGSPKSIQAGYPDYAIKKPSKSKKNKGINDTPIGEIRVSKRLGISGTSFIMIDWNEAILLERIDLSQVEAKEGGVNFLYGETIKRVENGAKAQINWALDEARVFPLLLVRPGKANVIKSLQISFTPHEVIVCSPNETFSFEVKKVRAARDFIIQHGLQKKWTEAARLRESIGNGEHLGTNRENKLLAEHAAMLKLFPLDVWLPEVNSGNQRALADALAEKPSPDLSKLTPAAKLLKPMRTAV